MAKSCAFLLSVALLAAPMSRAVMKRICIGLGMRDVLQPSRSDKSATGRVPSFTFTDGRQRSTT